MANAPGSEIFIQLSAMLTPAYRSMIHIVKLDPYANTNEHSLILATDMMRQLNPEIMSAVSIPRTSTTDESDDAQKPFVYHLLSDALISEADPQIQRTENFNQRVLDVYRMYKVSAVGKPGDCPITFWKIEAERFPLLGLIVRLVFKPPVTSTPSELEFGIAGMIRERRRARLTPDRTELLVKVRQFVRCPWRVMDK